MNNRKIHIKNINNKMASLENTNSHIRDKNIKFFEKGHIYDVNGDKSYTSVTTFVHRLFPFFNEDKIIDKMMNGANWKNSKYYNMTKDEIKTLWKINRIESASLGTSLHQYIEDTYNNKELTDKQIEKSENNIEYTYFKNFQEKHNNLKPYRTEWTIYDEYYKISGSIDMTFINEDGTISIYDWKRCKKIEKDNNFKKFAKFPNSDLDDNNYTHYCLQLNTYKFILERNYDVKIKDMYLVAFHPENPIQNYEKIQVINLQSRVKKLLDQHYETKVKNLAHL
tara:strand:+ start:274 stop:1116 length:843 start_codon:yes stop_codon:yes gene_type:complete